MLAEHESAPKEPDTPTRLVISLYSSKQLDARGESDCLMRE